MIFYLDKQNTAVCIIQSLFLYLCCRCNAAKPNEINMNMNQGNHRYKERKSIITIVKRM